jgi:hypothetical protein
MTATANFCVYLHFSSKFSHHELVMIIDRCVVNTSRLLNSELTAHQASDDQLSLLFPQNGSTTIEFIKHLAKEQYVSVKCGVSIG